MSTKKEQRQTQNLNVRKVLMYVIYDQILNLNEEGMCGENI